MLLRGGVSEAGERILQPETIEAMTSRVRQGLFDQTFQHVIDFGLGVMINSNRHGAETVPYGFGRHASPGAFGHGGSQSSIGFADPEHDLVVVIIANGAPGEPAHQRRNRELTSAIYEDLGLAGAT
jgi:CubicO group peptidase (beta-lactamase class C family)